MRKHIIYFSIFITFGVSTAINAQRLYELTPYSFYQEWSLVSTNSRENLRVFKPKDHLGSATSINSNSVLKFKRRSHVFYSANSKPIKQKRSLNWSNAPKKIPRKGLRCGNELIGKKNKVENHNGITQYSKKGIWKVYSKNNVSFLVLKHWVSVNGKGYTLDKKEEFQIVSLEEDKMVLRKVNDNGENL